MHRELIHADGGVRDLLYADMDHLRGIADYCKARQNEGLTGSKDMPHLAEYPAEVVEKYCNDAGITFAEWMQNPAHAQVMLRDPALAHFRINPMTIRADR